MRKTMVVLAMVVGLAGWYPDAQARGGGGKGTGPKGMQGAGEMTGQQMQERRQEMYRAGPGAGQGYGSPSGTPAKRDDGEMNRQQQREQNQEQYRQGNGGPGDQGAGDRARQRNQVRDPSLYTAPTAETPAE